MQSNRGPKIEEKKMILRHFRKLSQEQPFVGQTPTGRKRCFSGVLARFGAGALKLRAQAENRKTQFPGARGPETEGKNVTTLSGMVDRNFLTLNGLTDRTLTGGETWNSSFPSFWPRTAVGT